MGNCFCVEKGCEKGLCKFFFVKGEDICILCASILKHGVLRDVTDDVLDVYY